MQVDNFSLSHPYKIEVFNNFRIICSGKGAQAKLIAVPKAAAVDDLADQHKKIYDYITGIIDELCKRKDNNDEDAYTIFLNIKRICKQYRQNDSENRKPKAKRMRTESPIQTLMKKADDFIEAHQHSFYIAPNKKRRLISDNEVKRLAKKFFNPNFITVEVGSDTYQLKLATLQKSGTLNNMVTHSM